MDIVSNITTFKRTVQLKHPGTGKYLGIDIELHSIYDEPVKKVERAITDRALKLRAKGKLFNSDQIERNTLDILIAATASWKWGKDEDGEAATLNGEVPEFTEENLRKFYSISWVREQVDEELGQLTSFFEK